MCGRRQAPSRAQFTVLGLLMISCAIESSDTDVSARDAAIGFKRSGSGSPVSAPPTPQPAEKANTQPKQDDEPTMQQAKSMCPKSHPVSYRPTENFDYCCTTCADKKGNANINCNPDYSQRTDTCKDDAFKKCPDPPCEDYKQPWYEPSQDDIVIDRVLLKLGLPVEDRSPPAETAPRTPTMLPIPIKQQKAGQKPPPRVSDKDAPQDADKGKYWYDPPPRANPPYSQRFDPWVRRDSLKLNKNMRRLNIGITISIKPDETSIFTNGAKQAAFFLRQTLMHRHNVVMVNLDLGTIANIAGDWNIHDVPIINFQEAKDRKFDLVVEEGMQLATSQLNYFRKSGAKIVTFRTGNDYFMTIENIMFRHAKSTIFNTVGYDMIWTIPSFNATSCFQHIAFKADVFVAPYVWSPFFVDGTNRLLSKRRKYLPVPRTPNGSKVVATFEPNLNVVKSSIIPMVILESFYHRYPELINKAIITNAAKSVNKSDEFVHFAAGLAITKEKKIWFEGRYKFPWFMSEYADVVLSHHWANGLNFLYIDALYNRYPLVHNSEYFKDCGYYYPASDLEAAVKALHRAITEHDNNIEAYAAAADACIYRYSIHNPSNVAGFEKLINQVLAQPPKPLSVAAG